MMDQFPLRKFIETIQSKFDPQEHQFIIIKKKHKKNYIDPKNYQNVELLTITREKRILEFIVSHIKFFTFEYLKLRKLMKQVDYIFIHNLTEEISGILFRFKGKAKKLWVIWGVDLYDYIPLNLFDHYTLELLPKLHNKVLTMLIRFYYSFFRQIRKSIIKRIDYVVTPHKGDVRLLKKYFRTKARWHSQAIYSNPVEFKKLDLKDNYSVNEKFNFKKNGGKLILLGNSGTPTNNHLDILIRLSKMEEKNFTIICPLSYGSPIYIKKIIEKGKLLFGERFIPLLDFLKPELYFLILKQIDLAVMNHNRQQGMGTIHILVYLGKPICMKKTSGYFFLIEKGINIFSIQDLEKIILNEIKITQAMSEKNKKIASEKLYTAKNAISSIARLLEFIDIKDNM